MTYRQQKDCRDWCRDAGILITTMPPDVTWHPVESIRAPSLVLNVLAPRASAGPGFLVLTVVLSLQVSWAWVILHVP